MLNIKVEIVGLEWLKPLVARLTWKVDNLMATLDERFAGITTKLDEASTEILAEIDNLKKGGTLTPEQEAALAAIETRTNALADIAPPVA